jgi:hypothetical protein
MLSSPWRASSEWPVRTFSPSPSELIFQYLIKLFLKYLITIIYLSFLFSFRRKCGRDKDVSRPGEQRRACGSVEGQQRIRGVRPAQDLLPRIPRVHHPVFPLLLLRRARPQGLTYYLPQQQSIFSLFFIFIRFLFYFFCSDGAGGAAGAVQGGAAVQQVRPQAHPHVPLQGRRGFGHQQDGRTQPRHHLRTQLLPPSSLRLVNPLYPSIYYHYYYIPIINNCLFIIWSQR